MRRTTNGHDEQLRPILLRKSPELLLGSTTAFGRLLPVAKGRNRPKAVDQYLADSDQKVPVGGLSNLPGSQAEMVLTKFDMHHHSEYFCALSRASLI